MTEIDDRWQTRFAIDCLNRKAENPTRYRGVMRVNQASGMLKGKIIQIGKKLGK